MLGFGVPSRRVWPLIFIIFVTLLLSLSTSALGQEDSEPETETFSEQGYCTNPQVDTAGATWQRSYYFEGRTVLSLQATLTSRKSSVWSGFMTHT